MGGLEKEKTTKNNIKHTKEKSLVVVAHPSDQLEILAARGEAW
jgi:hypothetical protein